MSEKRTIDPVTDAYLEDDAVLEMDTIQLSGVDSTVRKTSVNSVQEQSLLYTKEL